MESMRTFGFIGLGLIGGSLAKAIHLKYPDARIMAYTRTRRTSEEALNAGVGYKKVWAEYYTYKKVRYKELIMYEEELNNEGFDKFLKALKISL